MRDVTVYVSQANIHAQVEAFLRATALIHDDEVVEMSFVKDWHDKKVVPVQLKITKEVEVS